MKQQQQNMMELLSKLVKKERHLAFHFTVTVIVFQSSSARLC